jgi:hypothetical protein
MLWNSSSMRTSFRRLWVWSTPASIQEIVCDFPWSILYRVSPRCRSQLESLSVPIKECCSFWIHVASRYSMRFWFCWRIAGGFHEGFKRIQNALIPTYSYPSSLDLLHSDWHPHTPSNAWDIKASMSESLRTGPPQLRWTTYDGAANIMLISSLALYVALWSTFCKFSHYSTVD